MQSYLMTKKEKSIRFLLSVHIFPTNSRFKCLLWSFAKFACGLNIHEIMKKRHKKSKIPADNAKSEHSADCDKKIGHQITSTADNVLKSYGMPIKRLNLLE
jgi:hypothetical protein